METRLSRQDIIFEKVHHRLPPTEWAIAYRFIFKNIVKDEDKAMREKGIQKANEQEKEGVMIEVPSSSSACSDSDSDSESS